jgi:hypothetical protein
LHLFIYLRLEFGETQTNRALILRTKSFLAGDLKAKHPVWNSQVSNPSSFKLLGVFVKCNLEILAPQHSTHFVPDGRGDVLDIVVHKDVQLLEISMLHILDSNYIPIMFCILDHVKAREVFDAVEKFTQSGSSFKALRLT